MTYDHTLVSQILIDILAGVGMCAAIFFVTTSITEYNYRRHAARRESKVEMGKRLGVCAECGAPLPKPVTVDPSWTKQTIGTVGGFGAHGQAASGSNLGQQYPYQQITTTGKTSP